MTLNDDRIRSLIDADGLIRGHDPRNVQNCGCMLTAGTVFAADTGEEVPLGSGSTETQHFWELPPSETLIVMTREVVKMPERLWASYGPLNRHARSGVMLLNPAIVEPCYEGPLSCFLLNFSSKRVQIARGEPISKILFHELNAPPSEPAPMQLDDSMYKVDLSKAATLFHRSFLDVTGIEDRAASKAQRGLKNWLIGFGAFLTLLVGFSAIEPLISRFVLERTGIVTTTQRTADARLQEELERSRALLQSTNDVRDLETRVATELDEIKTQLETVLQELGTLQGNRP